MTSPEKGFDIPTSNTSTDDEMMINAAKPADTDHGTKLENKAPSSFASLPLVRSDREDQMRMNVKESEEDGEDEDVKMPGQLYIRQRNAIYSRRKYYKKKRYIEQLKASRFQLETCNYKLRENNAQLESMLQRAKEAVAMKEQSTAAPIVMAQGTGSTPLQALLLLQQRQRQVEATLANPSLSTVQHQPPISSIGSVIAQDNYSIPNLTRSGLNTAITRQALQHGTITPGNPVFSGSNVPIRQYLPSATLRNPATPTAADTSLLQSALSLLPMIDNTLLNTIRSQYDFGYGNEMSTSMNRTTRPPSTVMSQSVFHDLLLRAGNNDNNGNHSTYSGNLSSRAYLEYWHAQLQDQPTFRHTGTTGNSNLSILEALQALQDRQPRFLENNSNNIGNSSLDIMEALKVLQEEDQQAIRNRNNDVGTGNSGQNSIMEALKSLQEQQTIRNILMANEHAQQQSQPSQQQQPDAHAAASVTARIDNATAAAHHHLLQTQSLDQSALLQYYLSLSGRRR